MGYFIECGFFLTTNIENSLMDMYAKKEQLALEHSIFQRMENKDTIYLGVPWSHAWPRMTGPLKPEDILLSSSEATELFIDAMLYPIAASSQTLRPHH